MEDVIEKLKWEINQNEKVKNSVLGKSSIWKNTHYEVLSSIINDALLEKIEQNSENFYSLGNSISQITLKRLFEGNVKTSAHHDLRFLKTLDKLAIFLGFQDLNHFISESKENTAHSSNVYEITDQQFQLFKKLILGCCTTEFNAMRTLTEINLIPFRKYIIENSPYEHRLSLYLEKMQSYGIEMVESACNFEIYDYKIASVEGNMIVMSTNEFWNLIFEKNGTHYPFHKKGEQTYYLKFFNGEWKIWDNYNPDFEDIINPKKS